MTIFANCHIFKKNTEIVIYDKKKKPMGGGGGGETELKL